MGLYAEFPISNLTNVLGLLAGRHGMRHDRPGGASSPAPAPAGGANPTSHPPVARQEQAQR